MNKAGKFARLLGLAMRGKKKRRRTRYSQAVADLFPGSGGWLDPGVQDVRNMFRIQAEQDGSQIARKRILKSLPGWGFDGVNLLAAKGMLRHARPGRPKKSTRNADALRISDQMISARKSRADVARELIKRGIFPRGADPKSVARQMRRLRDERDKAKADAEEMKAKRSKSA